MGDFKMNVLREILLSISDASDLAWVYLPAKGQWDLDSQCVALESEEVPPELEDEPDAGVPDFAKEHELVQVLPVSTVKEIVSNALMQKPEACVEELFQAFEFYYRHDAFIEF